MAGRTTFLIAHRLSTVRKADVILVLDHGRLVEQGTHESLRQLGGLYKQLHDLQNRRLRRHPAQGVAPSGLRPSRAAAGGAARPARVDGEAGADIALLGKAEKTAPANAVAVYAAAPKPPAARSGGKGKIVLLGMMSKFPVAGAVWGTMQYLIGFRR